LVRPCWLSIRISAVGREKSNAILSGILISWLDGFGNELFE
jgi:hypothetical protein